MLAAAGQSNLWHRRRAIILFAARQLSNADLRHCDLDVAKVLAANLLYMPGEQHPGVVSM
jgi:hypothetical protein